MQVLPIVLIICLSVDVFLTGTVAGYLNKKPRFAELMRLFLMPSLIPAVILLAGFFTGLLAGDIFKDSEAIWYGATVLFILSLKQLYDGFRLNKMKKTINPLDGKGLFVLSVFAAINAFFVGLSLGFIHINQGIVLRGLGFFIFAIIFGFLMGRRLKKLISFRFELLISILYLVSALLIVIKL